MSIECEGTVTPGVGFLVGFRSPRPLDSGPDPAFNDWMKSVVMAVLRTGDRIFEGQEGDRTVVALAHNLAGLESAEGFRIESAEGVPALQAEALDGRRLELELTHQGREPSLEIRREVWEPSVSRSVQQGNTGVREHERRRFRFRPAPLRPISDHAGDIPPLSKARHCGVSGPGTTR